VSPARRIKAGLTLLGAILAIGTAGFVIIEDASVFESFYMVVITITTVGFAEIFELSTLGRVWTTLILIGGFGVALYTAVASIEYVVDLAAVRTRRNMEKRVAQLRDHVIICGFGRVGRGTFNVLRDREVDTVIIESDHDRAEAAMAANALVIRGDATHNDVLELAGIEHAQALVACVAVDSDNLVIALSAKSLRPDVRVICRATEIESERKLRLAGADAVVAPQAVGAERLAMMATQPELAQVFDVVVHGAPVEFHVEELDVSSGCKVVGKTIRDSNIRQVSGALILAVEDHEDRILINPGPDVTLQVGDRLVVVGTREQVTKAEEILRPPI
jgi:voltage-gated potassium channel